MRVTPRKREEINRRRAAVAKYRVLGYGPDAIVEALAAEGVRPRDGARWSRRSITLDLEHLRLQYTLDAQSDIAKWMDAELDILNYALASAVQGVVDKAKAVVGYRHVQRRDPATGSLQEIKEPIFETVENLLAIDRVVKVTESRRRLLGVDKYFKMQSDAATAHTGLDDAIALLTAHPALAQAVGVALIQSAAVAAPPLGDDGTAGEAPRANAEEPSA